MSADTVWTETRSGDLDPDRVNVQHVRDEPGTLVMFKGKPDWAMDPETGTKVRFIALARQEGSCDCPACGAVARDPVLALLESAGHPEHVWIGLDCPACRRWSFRLVAQERVRLGFGEAPDPESGEPFCACGRRRSECDGSRAGCPR